MTVPMPGGVREQEETQIAALIFSCSGASTNGLIADQIARQLDSDGTGRMSCIAGIGGRVHESLELARAAPMILVIDGCEKDCAKLALQHAGVAEKIRHIRVTDLDKESPNGGLREVHVGKVVRKVKEAIAS